MAYTELEEKMGNEPRFVIVPEYIDRLNITDSEKLLAGRIYALAAKKGYCYASDNFLANDRKTSERTIQRRLKKLIKNKAFTVVTDRKGKKISKRKLYIGDVPTELTIPIENDDEVPTTLSQGTDKSGDTRTDKSVVESSRVESSRVTSRISPKGDRAKAQFGNSEINKILDCLKNELGGVPIDGTQKENRQYANSFLSKLKKMCKEQGQAEDRAADLGCFIISAAHKGWHTKNATNMKYIFYNMGKIIQQTKQGGEVLEV